MKISPFLPLLACLLAGSPSHAQPYVQMKSQHRFAQTYVGLNTQIIPSSGLMIWNGDPHAFPRITSPRVTIGGLHFWGKVDFNINVPLSTHGDFSLDPTSEFEFKPGGDLSARYYPWRMEYGKPRPYVGVSFNGMVFGIQTEDSGARRDLFITSSPLGGISFASRRWQINAELMWLPNPRRTFFSDRNTSHTFELPTSYVSIGLVRYFDGTLREEEDMRSGRTEELESTFRRAGMLNSFSVAVAPSESFFLRAPSLEDPIRQSLPRHKASFVWDLGLGYLFHDAGLHVGMSYRAYTSRVESYEFQHLIRRQSFALEGFKFFWDYNGFVPFVGPSISFERWATGEFEGEVQVGTTQRKRMISPGLIFGWDILASPLETWVLRTNLRYYPFQKMRGTDGRTARVDQFEFNFIQLVLYPNRLLNYPKVRGRI